jgi:hypothetical protein
MELKFFGGIFDTHTEGRVKSKVNLLITLHTTICEKCKVCIISQHNYPLFQHILYSSSQVFLSHMQRKTLVVIRAMYAMCP